ncbi:MAG: FecR family protein, partial [Tannerellaceae bacterium]|nr:FecR family protein [Tannerellaceae bacterium]
YIYNSYREKMKDSIENKNNTTAENILRIYMDSEPDSKLDKQVKLWLISDFHKEEKEAILQHIWNILSVTDDSGKKRIWDAIQRKTGLKQPKKQILPGKIIWQVSAAILPFILFALGLWFYNNYNKTGQKTEVIAEVIRTTIETMEEIHHLILHDGTEVWLNKNSSFTYGDDRQVHLTGEAFFKVAHHPSEKFVLQTNDIIITVLGTNFNLKIYPEEEIRVTLYEGSLELAIADTTVMMTFGDEWVYNRNQSSCEMNRTSKSGPTWNRETIMYENVPLHSVFKDLERKYGVQIEAYDPAILNDTLTLKFENDIQLSEILFLIARVNGKFDYLIDDKTIRIKQTNN